MLNGMSSQILGKAEKDKKDGSGLLSLRNIDMKFHLEKMKIFLKDFMIYLPRMLNNNFTFILLAKSFICFMM